MSLNQLDDFDYTIRKSALNALKEEGISPKVNNIPVVNLHAHTFYSYNAYGYSPTHFAYLAKQEGLEVAGIVDFDVLDGVEEFRQAGKLLELKTCAGIESRVFIQELSQKVINSPGEPGVSYHVGVGIVDDSPIGWCGNFLKTMQETAKKRNEELVARVNAYLAPVEINIETDVYPLTPAKNITERHICAAYAQKAKDSCKEAVNRFWSEKLGLSEQEIIDLSDAGLLDLIRAKTMKQGGVGYVKPGKDTFPLLADMNKFIIGVGGIPAITWLDGTTEAEQSIDELLEIEIANGSVVLNIIPDRNFTPGVVDDKLKNLQDIIEKARKLGLPIIVGTEMNKDGNLFADRFDSDELAPFNDDFLNGAYIVYAHSVLQRESGMGYLSEWAGKQFKDVFEKNRFFAEFGKRIQVKNESNVNGVADLSPKEILEKL